MALCGEAKMMRSPMLFFVTNMKVGGSKIKEICLDSHVENVPFADEYNKMLDRVYSPKAVVSWSVGSPE